MKTPKRLDPHNKIIIIIKIIKKNLDNFMLISWARWGLCGEQPASHAPHIAAELLWLLSCLICNTLSSSDFFAACPTLLLGLGE